MIDRERGSAARERSARRNLCEIGGTTLRSVDTVAAATLQCAWQSPSHLPFSYRTRRCSDGVPLAVPPFIIWCIIGPFCAAARCTVSSSSFPVSASATSTPALVSFCAAAPPPHPNPPHYQPPHPSLPLDQQVRGAAARAAASATTTIVRNIVALVDDASGRELVMRVETIDGAELVEVSNDTMSKWITGSTRAIRGSTFNQLVEAPALAW